MTSKLVVNTIESDTGISSVSFASSISMSSTSKFHFSNAGIDIGADTNINRPAAGVLGFNINGGEKVRINSNGFIGINTSSPLAPLHTYNDTNNTIARLESGDATCRLQLKDSAGEGYVIASGDNLILANTSSITERLRINSSGNLLVGRNNDYWNSRAAFQEDKNGRTAILVKNDTNHADASSSIILNAYGNSWTMNCGSTARDSNSFTINQDATSNSNQGTERLRITTSGALGTNSTVRSANGGLDLCSQGATNLGTLTLGAGGGQNGQSRNSNQENQFRIMMPTYANPSNMTTVLYGTSGNAGHDLFYGGGTGWAYATNTHRFFTTANQTTGTGTERIRILANGHVAIGHDIANDTGMFKVIAADGQSDDQYVGQFKNLEATTNRNWGLLVQAGSSSTDESFRVRNSANNADHLLVRGNGIISMPKQPMVRTRGGWSNVDWNGYKQMSWNGEDEDIGGNFSSGVFTVPSGGAGRYIMTAQFIGPSSAGQFVLWSFFKNTTALNPWVQIYSGSTNTETGAGTVAITCAVGDTLRIAWHGSYSSPYNGGYNSFSIYKVH